MENRLFTPEQVHFLLVPHQWRVVGSCFRSDVRSVRNPRHAQWAADPEHTTHGPGICFVLSGSGFQRVGHRVYPARGGTVFIYDAHTPRDLRYPPWQGVAEHLSVYFVRDRCVIRLVDIGTGSRLYRERWGFILNARDLGIHSPEALFAAPSPDADPGDTRFRFVALAAFFASLAVDRGFTPSPEKHDVRRDVVDAVVRHIQQATGRDCSLNRLSAIAGYSKYHFLRLFHRATGRTPHAYIDECRRDAWKTMSSSGMRTSAIARSLGFSNASAFGRWLKRQPSEHGR